jgi:hypothetical protein
MMEDWNNGIMGLKEPSVFYLSIQVLIASKEVRNRPFLSFLRKPESSENDDFRPPDFAGVTALMAFYEPLSVPSFHYSIIPSVNTTTTPMKMGA